MEVKNVQQGLYGEHSIRLKHAPCFELRTTVKVGLLRVLVTCTGSVYCLNGKQRQKKGLNIKPYTPPPRYILQLDSTFETFFPFLSLSLFLKKIGSLYVVLVDLELTTQTWLALQRSHYVYHLTGLLLHPQNIAKSR